MTDLLLVYVALVVAIGGLLGNFVWSRVVTPRLLREPAKTDHKAAALARHAQARKRALELASHGYQAMARGVGTEAEIELAQAERLAKLEHAELKAKVADLEAQNAELRERIAELTRAKAGLSVVGE